MKRSIRAWLLLLLAFCFFAALSGCSAPPEDVKTEVPAANAPALQESAVRLVLDGVDVGQLYELDDVLYVNAQALCSAWGIAVTEEDNTLRIETDGAVLTLHSGSDTAETSAGNGIPFDAPVLRRPDGWYLPVSALEAVSGRNLVSLGSEDVLQCLSVGEGTDCWLGGTWLGPTRRVNGALCGSLRSLADAVGGTLSDRDGALVLSAFGHELVLYPGDTRAAADDAAMTLPVPLIPTGEDWLVPLGAAAQILGLQEQALEDGGVAYSRMLPCETVIYIDGKKAETFTLPEGGLFVRLNDAAAAAEGSFLIDGNTAALTAWRHEISLQAGSAEMLADGETRELSAPVMADGTVWYAPSDLFPVLGLTQLQDPELDQLYYTHVVRHDAIPTGYRVPVLMYHAVGDDIWGIRGLFVSPSVLDEQVRSLVEAGYTPITFEDLDRIDEIEKPVIMTFDDGYDNNYTDLFPILQKYNAKATVFMIVNDVGIHHKLTVEQIQEMSNSGLVSFQSHTMSHSSLAILDESQLRYEHNDSIIGLARITGKQPFVMCYPAGKSSYFSRTITAEYYEFGINMVGPCYVTGSDPYQVNRYYVLRDTDLNTFMSFLEG